MKEPSFDIERARAETRGCRQRIHFNNAGAALPPIPVADGLYSYLREEELLGGYETMARRAEELDRFYTAAARLLNCGEEEIAFTDSATRAWNGAFYALAFRPGDRILAGSSEYGSNLVALLQQANRLGVEIGWVPDDATGQIDLAALERLIDPRVKLICLTQIPSGNGLINPAAAVGRLAKGAGIPFLLDACQALGQLRVDVEQIGCDLLCGTSRKFLRGPRGGGLLYVRQSLLEQLEPNQLNHHAAQLLSTRSYRLRPDAKRFECWERSYAVQAALGLAIDYALEWDLDRIAERIDWLATTLRRELATIGGVTLCDRGQQQCGIVTFTTAQLPAEPLQRQLAGRNINCSVVGFSANPVSFGSPHQPPLLRASLHYYNTLAEIDGFLDALRAILRGPVG